MKPFGELSNCCFMTKTWLKTDGKWFCLRHCMLSDPWSASQPMKRLMNVCLGFPEGRWLGRHFLHGFSPQDLFCCNVSLKERWSSHRWSSTSRSKPFLHCSALFGLEGKFRLYIGSCAAPGISCRACWYLRGFWRCALQSTWTVSWRHGLTLGCGWQFWDGTG